MDNLLISQESVSLQCVFHSIRFKVNKGWSKALLLFLCLYASSLFDINQQKLSLFNHQILLAQSEILEIRFRATPPLKIDSFLSQKGMKQILL
ncbi:hypothetical protein F6S82_16665 [Bacteroides xylanisolvens]|uniref:Uncharacterized protein n=1 Tax=Bacteroides xylanisolvens TaxID=371601 RepID=A0AAI9RZL1_9BACE|nr:hypothetical protein F6S82_16665 [Bacteroides xylanisolvens]